MVTLTATALRKKKTIWVCSCWCGGWRWHRSRNQKTTKTDKTSAFWLNIIICSSETMMITLTATALRKKETI